MQAEKTIVSLEEYYERGKLAASAIDQGRWIIGDDAVDIGTSYGGKEVEAYATQIGVAKTRVMEYRTVCRFYERSARTEYLRNSHDLVSYSHMRDAMRLGDVGTAYRFLDTVIQSAMTVEKARLALIETLGKPVPPVRVTFEAIYSRNGICMTTDADGYALEALMRDHPAATVTVTVSYPAKEPTNGD